MRRGWYMPDVQHPEHAHRRLRVLLRLRRRIGTAHVARRWPGAGCWRGRVRQTFHGRGAGGTRLDPALRQSICANSGGEIPPAIHTDRRGETAAAAGSRNQVLKENRVFRELSGWKDRILAVNSL